MDKEEATKLVLQQLSSLLEYAKQGIEFAKDQAPALVQDIIQWGIWSNSVKVLLLGLALVYIYRRVPQWIELTREAEADSFEEVTGVIRAIAGGLIGFWFLLWWFFSVMNAIKAIAAPRLYLIEFLMELLKPAAR